MSWSVNAQGFPSDVEDAVTEQLQEQHPKDVATIAQGEQIETMQDAVAQLFAFVPEGAQVSIDGSGHIERDGTGTGYLSWGIFFPIETMDKIEDETPRLDAMRAEETTINLDADDLDSDDGA